jgi:inner membrane protein
MDLSITQIWVIVGVALLIAELLTTSFWFVFLSFGSLITAALTWVGVTPTFNGQLLAFSIISVTSLIVLRKPLRIFLKSSKGHIEYSEYIGDKANVVEPISAHGEGKVFYRGSEWIALSENNTAIDANKMVIIKQLDGIKLIVSEF